MVMAMVMVAGADPGFFLGGGALVSSNKPHSFFFCRISAVFENRRSSQGRVRTPGTLPLDPPLGGKGDGVSGKNNNNDNNKKKKKKGDESLTLE